MDQNRLKSPVAWAAVVALIVAVVLIFFGKDISAQANTLFGLISTVMLAFGIWNNPTNKTGV